ncbi:MAG TPA: N-6 DNA methylase [Pyrinomonadaceae bacterium]|jgi:type I restriction enzyme M protein|nr:N-6 DNA methylase [Pyrinomonadaceae bacterium]
MRISSQQLEKLFVESTDLLRNVFPLNEAVQQTTGLMLLRLLITTLDPELKTLALALGRGHLTWDTIQQAANPIDVLYESANQVDLHFSSARGAAALILWDKLFVAPRLTNEVIYLISRMDMAGLTSSEIAEITDSLIEKMAFLSGVQGGESYTSRDISALIVELIAPRAGERIFDPACGTGGLLATANRYLETGEKSEGEAAFFGQDINEKSVALARINTFLHRMRHSTIERADSLLGTDPGLKGNFDIVLSNPPIGLKLSQKRLHEIQLARDDFYYGPPMRVADFNFVQNALANLKDDGRCILLVGLRPLFIQGREGEIRKTLVKEDLIEAIITLPENLLPQTTAKSAILIFNKNKAENKRGRVHFISADAEFSVKGKKRVLDPAHRERIVNAFWNTEERDGFAVFSTIEKIELNNYKLIPESYLNPENLEVSFGGGLEWFDLGNDATIILGTKLGSRSMGNTPIIQGRDLTLSGLGVDDLEKKELSKEPSRIIRSQVGDILVQRIGQRPRFFLVEENLAGIIISDTVFVIRPRRSEHSRSRYLLEFFNSNAGQAKLNNAISGAVIPTLSISKLRTLKIPLPDPSVFSLLENLHETEEGLLTRINKAHTIKQQLFSVEDTEEFKSKLQNLSIELDVLSKSVVDAEDLNFQIRNYYPFVLAYAYRLLDAYADPSTLYKEQLRVAENLLAFLACIGLALVTDQIAKGDLGSDNLDQSLLIKDWQGGISPGSWLELAQKSGQVLRNLNEFAFISAFANMWFKGKGAKESHLAGSMRELVKLKNDFKHDRYPQLHEYDEAVENLRKILHECYRKIGFFVSYPVRLIQDSNQNWQTNVIVLNTLVYTGDHPGLKQEEMTAAAHFLKNHLYLELNPEKLVSLYPLISVHLCDSCKTNETYIIDSWNRSDNKIKLKSFERGHILKSNHITEQVGKDFIFWMQKNFPMKIESF